MNPYPVSAMYAIDRYASYQKDWGYDYQQEDMLFIADRYVPSNMIHQASKLQGEEKNTICLGWKPWSMNNFKFQDRILLFFGYADQTGTRTDEREKE